MEDEMQRQLFVGNLPFSVGWQDLKDVFREAGAVVRADVAVNPGGRSRGFGTVLFSTTAEAQAAIARFNGYEWDNRSIQVRIDQKPAAAAAPDALYVGNIPYSVGWQDLKDLFREAGSVVRADVPSDQSGRSKGFGTIVMASSKDAQNAIGSYIILISAMFAGYEWNGRKIDVRADNRPPPMHQAPPVKADKCLLFVGNLPFSVQWQELKDLFKQVATVDHADVSLDFQGRSRGFGQVVMSSPEDAQEAIRQLNGTDLNGRMIEVRLDKFSNGKANVDVAKENGAGPNKSGGGTLLPYSTRWQEVKDLFKQVGPVNHADIMLDQNGRSKGCGTVSFADPADAARAIAQINGTSFEGRIVVCRLDKFQ